MTIKLNKTYLTITILFLITEVLIAVYLKTGFIRHTLGDFISTILLYTFFKSFFKLNSIKLGISVITFAFIVEFSQWINILEIIGLENNHLVKVILGSTFQFSDLVAYTLGIIFVLAIEFKLNKI